MIKGATPRSVIFFLLLAVLPNSALAQEKIIGYPDSQAEAERTAERRLQEFIAPQRLDTLVKELSGIVRIAGTDADRTACDLVVKDLREHGLVVKEYPYSVYLPEPIGVSLEMKSPTRHTYDLHEKVYPEEDANLKEYPWVNGYSGNGTAEGAVVYVNFGLQDDYAALDSMGISLRGKIAIARYGKSYRGVKAQLAEEHGAVGLLLFSDPSGDGYVNGDVFPTGPMRPADGVQRGSIYNGHGDPTTPDGPSIAGVKRVAPSVAAGLVHIPVIPISCTIAEDILSALGGRAIPNQSWQGALPLRYHVGAGPAVVALSVRCDSMYRTITNTIATVEGSTLPNEWVIVGGHRDAWGPGAEDNASGCAAVMAAAEAVARLAKEGIRPKRSILFATWDAEEWGLLGSTEWVEQMQQACKANAVAYINEDECATGKNFDCGADPLLRTFLRQVTKDVEVPGNASVYQIWRQAEGDAALPIGLLGGGSDFTSFEGHLGIPSISQGFGGPFGQYHSMHDNYYYVRHFGDTSFAYHAGVARLAAVEALRIANVEIAPYDFEELGGAMMVWVDQVRRSVPTEWDVTLELDRLHSEIQNMRNAGQVLNEARFERLATATPNALVTARINDRLHDVALAFAPVSGLSSDPWVHNLLVCTDPANGYADMTLPNLNLAIRASDKEAFELGIVQLQDCARKVTAELYELEKVIASR